MNAAMQSSQKKALRFWAWALWIGFACWAAQGTAHGGWDFLFFTFLALLPKGFRGLIYVSTARQNRFSEGYTDKDRSLPIYWAITIGLFVIVSWRFFSVSVP